VRVPVFFERFFERVALGRGALACSGVTTPCLLAGLLVLAACGSTTPRAPVANSNTVPEPATSATPGRTKVTAANVKPGNAGAAATSRSTAPPEVRTRNALFRRSAFDELPGWQSDDLRAGWGAFRNSCDALQRRESWREICTASRSVPANDPAAIRSFYESRFAVLRILNTDNSREGEVTGYFEPLLEGRRERSGEFDVPVLGTPADLYTMDWARVPAAQRRTVIRVAPNGPILVPVAGTPPGSFAMDMRRFTLDDRDRRLRVRLVGDGPTARIEPYYTRAELEALGLPNGIPAPVIAWVNDPLALYAMQVQGSGRIRLPDGSIVRVQYAEQNGHPFKPLRVAVRPKATVVTRGTAVGSEPDEFVIEGSENGAPSTDAEGDEPVLTRGGAPRPAAAPAVPATAPRREGSDAMVDALLANKRAARSPAAPRSAPASPTSGVAGKLVSDPSYVFFKTVQDRPLNEGPQGALGVALTPGRSVAVDPRVTPLGYPVFLNAPAPSGSSIAMQRLVFAQDTGGAMRGALRADYFWGFGAEAGQKARSTRHRGQMWVMMPLAEAAQLSASRIVTRGAATGGTESGEASTCLIDDGEFCTEID
jgi:membrane-bound lytic murein transglycosylase A